MRLKGKLVHGGPDVGEAVIELEPGEIKVGDIVLVKMEWNGLGDYTLFPNNVVAVLPQEPEKKEIEPLPYMCITETNTDTDEALIGKINELIKVVNEMRKK